MKKIIFIILFYFNIQCLALAQDKNILIDSIAIETKCLTSYSNIQISKKQYYRTYNSFGFEIWGPDTKSDTTITLEPNQIAFFNREITKLYKVKSKSRFQRTNMSCGCYSEIILLSTHTKLGRFEWIHPPRVFRKLVKQINKIDNQQL